PEVWPCGSRPSPNDASSAWLERPPVEPPDIAAAPAFALPAEFGEVDAPSPGGIAAVEGATPLTSSAAIVTVRLTGDEELPARSITRARKSNDVGCGCALSSSWN